MYVCTTNSLLRLVPHTFLGNGVVCKPSKHSTKRHISLTPINRILELFELVTHPFSDRLNMDPWVKN